MLQGQRPAGPLPSQGPLQWHRRHGQTTQSGSLTAGESEQCPLRNRLGIAADTAVEAELQWWIDDQEQPPLLERYPPRGDSDEEPDPDQPQQLA